jgi:hypothetical protein
MLRDALLRNAPQHEDGLFSYLASQDRINTRAADLPVKQEKPAYFWQLGQ